MKRHWRVKRNHVVSARVQNFHYDTVTRAKMGKYVAENSNSYAVKKLSRELGRPISERTVCVFRKAYSLDLKKVEDPDMIVHLEHGLSRKPRKLGDLPVDQKVYKYIVLLSTVQLSLLLLGVPQSITAARAWRKP